MTLTCNQSVYLVYITEHGKCDCEIKYSLVVWDKKTTGTVKLHLCMLKYYMYM